MQFHKQRFLHEPHNGTFGDCDRTAMACLLNMNPDDVPHWGVHYDDLAAFTNMKEQWLATLGLFEQAFAFDCDRDALSGYLKNAFKDVYVLLTGKSRTGCHHVVVTLNGEIIHDPSLTDAGIVGPCEGGLWWCSLLLPIALKADNATHTDKGEPK